MRKPAAPRHLRIFKGVPWAEVPACCTACGHTELMAKAMIEVGFTFDFDVDTQGNYTDACVEVDLDQIHVDAAARALFYYVVCGNCGTVLVPHKEGPHERIP